MEVRYDLVPYSDALRDAYLELLPEQELEVARGKLEWKFRNAPSGAGAIAVAREEERVLGLNGFMSARMRLAGETVIGYQSMDTIVSPAARGKGVFGKLIKTFYERTDGALLYGFPNANSAPAFFGKLGWTRFSEVPMLVRPLRTGYFARKIARFLPNLPVPLFGRRMKEAEEITRFGDRESEQWRHFSAGIGCAVERDADFLNWRIADHPTERYTILRAPDGAFVVFNVADKHGARIGYLMEAVGEHASLARLIREALLRMRAKGAELAFAWSLPWAPNYRAYRSAGLYSFPPKLRPIELSFGARALRSEDARVTEPRSWYISYLDSDTA
jgi:GNAT superfamily N-acetyltransferase